MSEIDDAAVENKLFGWAAVGNGNENTARVLVVGLQSHANFGAERIKPGRGGQPVRIKPFAVGHKSATVFLAIPGGHSAGILYISERRVNDEQKQRGPEKILHDEYNHCWIACAVPREVEQCRAEFEGWL